METYVLGIGQSVAGDDGVGLAILDELRRRTLPVGTRILQLADAMDLVSILERQQRVVLVDAVLGSPAGLVVELTPKELASNAVQPASSHGLGPAQAIELASALSPSCALVRIVAVTINPPERYRVGLSTEVAAAVPKAAERVLIRLEVEHA